MSRCGGGSSRARRRNPALGAVPECNGGAAVRQRRRAPADLDAIAPELLGEVERLLGTHEQRVDGLTDTREHAADRRAQTRAAWSVHGSTASRSASAAAASCVVDSASTIAAKAPPS